MKIEIPDNLIQYFMHNGSGGDALAMVQGYITEAQKLNQSGMYVPGQEAEWANGMRGIVYGVKADGHFSLYNAGQFCRMWRDLSIKGEEVIVMVDEWTGWQTVNTAELYAMYGDWLDFNHLPSMSADELACEVSAVAQGEYSCIIAPGIECTREHVQWLVSFGEAWDSAQDAEDAANASEAERTAHRAMSDSIGDEE